MEVQRVAKTSFSRLGVKDGAAKDSASFHSIIDKKQADMSNESLNQKMKTIESIGSKLVESRTVENLRKYKKVVKEFLSDVVNNGLQIKDQNGFSQNGSARTYKLVKEVDQKLVDVTNAVLDKEKTGIDLLGMVGEIRGMLINLYT